MTKETGKDRGADDPDSARAVALNCAPPDVASNLRKIRHQQGMSLETLARLSGVSRAMLGQIETGKSVPTIKLIWKVAKALGVPTATLITSLAELPAAVVAHSEISTITSAGGGFVLRPFEAANFRQPFEFSEVLVSPGHREDRAGGLLGSRATLLVTSGSIDVQVGQDEPHRVLEGDSILIRADAPHHISNPGVIQAKGYLVVSPPRNSGR